MMAENDSTSSEKKDTPVPAADDESDPESTREEEEENNASGHGVDRRRKRDDCTDDEEETEKDQSIVTNESTRQEELDEVELAVSEEDVADEQQYGEMGSGDGNDKSEEGKEEEKRSDKQEEQEKEKGQEQENEREEEEEEGDEQDEEEGDEQDEEEGDEQDDEQDEEEEIIAKNNPMFVPRGPYFCHDSRSNENESESKDGKNQGSRKLPSAPRSRCQELNRWEHDKFIAEEQKPREDWEKERDRKYYDDLERRSRNRERDGRERERGRGVRLQDYIGRYVRSDYHYESRGGPANTGYRNRGKQTNEPYERRERRDKYSSRSDQQRSDYRREEQQHYNRSKYDNNSRYQDKRQSSDSSYYRERQPGDNSYRYQDRRERQSGDSSSRYQDRRDRQSGEDKRERQSSDASPRYKDRRERRSNDSSPRYQDKRERGQSSDRNDPIVQDRRPTPTGDEMKDKPDTTGEVQSLFKQVSFASSKVFSLSGQSNRLVVKEVEHKRKTAGKGRVRGTRDSRPTEPSEVNKEETQTEEEVTTSETLVVNTTDEPTTDTLQESIEKPATSPTPPVTDTPAANTPDTPLEADTDTPSVTKTATLDVTNTKQESPEIDSKTVKPKRYSSRRQKPESDAQNTERDTGIVEHSNLPPHPYQYGWVYPSHHSMIPMDPASYQQQPYMHQQMLFYQQQMRLLHGMYQHQQQHGGHHLVPVFPPSLPMAHPPDQFPSPQFLPSDMKPPTDNVESSVPYKGTEDQSVASGGLYIPQMAPEVQRLLQQQQPTSSSDKPSQAIPIVAPDNSS